MNRKSKPVPEPIEQLKRELDQFRSTQSGRTKLPASPDPFRSIRYMNQACPGSFAQDLAFKLGEGSGAHTRS